MQDFNLILQATLTPVALISGIGLLLLSMVNRYNHAIDRVRSLLKEKSKRAVGDWDKVDRSIAVIYKRCRVMRNAILCISISILSSGGIILASAIEGLGGADLYILKSILLLLSIFLVLIATVMFVVEVTYSLHALKIELEQ